MLIIAIILFLIYRLYKKGFYANAWVKNYNRNYPNSGLIRLWDYSPLKINDSMLNELYQISIKDI